MFLIHYDCPSRHLQIPAELSPKPRRLAWTAPCENCTPCTYLGLDGAQVVDDCIAVFLHPFDQNFLISLSVHSSLLYPGLLHTCTGRPSQLCCTSRQMAPDRCFKHRTAFVKIVVMESSKHGWNYEQWGAKDSQVTAVSFQPRLNARAPTICQTVT